MSARVTGLSEAGTMVAGFFIGIAGIAVFAITVTVRCFVISKMWGWYVVPFLSAPAMPLAVAFGFSLLVSFLVPRADKADDKKGFWTLASISVVGGLLTLLFGWLGTWFLP